MSDEDKTEQGYQDSYSDGMKPRIELTFDVPSQVSEEDALEYIKDIVLQANKLHRANGGKGLKVINVEVTRSKNLKTKEEDD